MSTPLNTRDLHESPPAQSPDPHADELFVVEVREHRTLAPLWRAAVFAAFAARHKGASRLSTWSR